jgi:molybdate transport system regulatory protein
MSYRRAWLLLDTMNRCFRVPVVQTSAGGAHGGGTRLTPLGHEVIARYRSAEAAAARAGKADLDALAALLR